MTLDKPAQQEQAVTPQPKAEKESRYTRFYLTMLVLSTIGTAFGLTALWAIQPSISEFPTSPINSVANLASALLVLPIAIVALVLLWLKRPLGIWLKLNTYAASVLISITNLLVAEQTLKNVIAQAIAEEAKQNTHTLSTDTITLVITNAYYAGLALAIITSIAFGALWWSAWKKQATADSVK